MDSSSKKKITIAISAIVTVFIVVPTIIYFVDYRSKNYDNIKLSSSQKAAQIAIQKKANRNDFKYVSTISEKNGWEVVKTNTVDQRNLYTVSLLKDGKVLLGPSEYLDINDLVKLGAPNEIIDKLYSDQTQWVGFTDNFLSSFSSVHSYLKAFIQSFAVSKGISLKRVSMIGSIKSGVDNPNDDNRTEYRTFQFKINDDSTEYTLRCNYVVEQEQYTVIILDANNNVVFSQSIDSDVIQ